MQILHKKSLIISKNVLAPSLVGTHMKLISERGQILAHIP